MEKNLTPLQATLLLTFFLGLIGVIAWLHAESVAVPHLTHLHRGPHGGVAALLGDRLYLYASDGRPTRQLVLGEDFEPPLAGADFAFLDDDTLIARAAGAPRPGLLFELKRFARLNNDTPEHAADDRANLLRCSLATRRCQAFATPPLNLNDVYHLAVDRAGGRLFVADTSRHRVLVLGADGRTRSTIDQGLRFPNQLAWRSGVLHIANTNRHRISRFRIGDDGAPAPMRGGPDLRGLDGLDGHRWPTGVLPLDDGTLVIAMRASMREGIGLRFAADEQHFHALHAPPGADLLEAVRFADGILVSDTAGDRILRYTLDGQPLSPFDGGAAMRERIAALGAERRRLRAWMWGAITLFAVALGIGFIVAIRQTLDGVSGLPEVDDEERSLRIDDPAIHWIPKDRAFQRASRSSLWLLPLFLVLLVMVSMLIGDAVRELWFALGGFLSIVLFIAWFQHRLTRQRLGVAGDLLVAVNGGRHEAARAQRVRYSGNLLAVGERVVVLRNPRSVFDESELVQHVYPLLKDARSLSASQMSLLYLKDYRWPFAWLVLGLILMLVFSWRA